MQSIYRWFETRITPFPDEPPTQPPSTLGAFFWFYLRPVWWAFAWLTLATFLLAMLEVAILAFVGRVVDLMKAASTPADFFKDHAVELGLMAVLAIIVRPVLSALADLFKHQLIMGPVNVRIRWLAHRYLLRQSLGFFQNDFAGRLATRTIQVGPAVRDVAANTCDVVVWVAVHWFGAMLLFFQADWRLVLPLAVWLALYVGALFYFVPRIEKLSAAMSDARSMLTGRIVDSYTNISTVKLFAHTEREDLYARDAMGEWLARYQAQLRLNTLMEACLWTVNGLVLVGTTGLAIWLWSIGEVTIGSIAVVSGLVIRLMNMSGWFMWSLAGIFDNVGVVQESMRAIAHPLQLTDAPEAKPIAVKKGEIRYEGIRFHYGKEQGVIDNLSLTIRPGEKVGLVGRSGAGKSTLVSLLLRFYDLEGGRILIDGQDISKISQDSLRAQIGLVTQDTSLLHRSVAENILYGRPDAGEAAMIAAAKKAQAHDFILGLEDGRGRKGYDAHVGERGVKLSGGQRQRIAIARVLLKNAPILVLDEATSALDSEVEGAIQEQLNNLMEGKTVIAIAHRLSTIAAMDRLVIMDNGAIVETGTHGELLARGGLYASLWARQSGGFLAKEAAE
ncbi:MAG TPA: ABC transporter ATP-binding protein [Hyphomicrobiaceae bacterium]|nr:ABC transporter ATP-binding protein [Hyphomicrobiaceae bacterium]